MKLQMLIDGKEVGQPMSFGEAQAWQWILKRFGSQIRWRKV